jgi:hypothetical protein
MPEEAEDVCADEQILNRLADLADFQLYLNSHLHRRTTPALGAYMFYDTLYSFENSKY